MNCICSNLDDAFKYDAFDSLRGVSNGVRLINYQDSSSSVTVELLYEASFLYADMLGLLSASDTSFFILYQKNNSNEDFTELVPYLLLQHEFGNSVSLYIDVGHLNLKSQSKYLFKCSNFLILSDISSDGLSRIYIVNERMVDKITGEIIYVSWSHITRLRGEGRGNYTGDPSKRYLPLLRITGNNYKYIFGIGREDDSKEQKFVYESIEKIKKEWEGKRTLKSILPALNSVFDPSASPFEQWFESAFFYSYDTKLKDFKIDEIQGIRNTLRTYKNCITELVQNIIFHGGKEGLLYCVFDKRINISSQYRSVIPSFDNYDDNARFLRIGIFDFGKQGIIDTFRKNFTVQGEEPITLHPIFDATSIVTTGLTRLDMRYAARLGIKTFVKTIIEHKGYFSVESNDSSVGRKKRIQTAVNDNVVRLGNEEEVVFSDGTHYEIVLPVEASGDHSKLVLPLQRASLMADSFNKSFKFISNKKPLRALKLSEIDFSGINNSENKSEQIQGIINTGQKIITTFFSDKEGGSGDIVFDLDGHNIAPNIVFRIVSYIQLNVEYGLEKVILVNTTDSFVKEFYGLIDEIVAYKGSDEVDSIVWSRDAAIIIISEDLYAKIIWGETKDELYFINQEFQKLYCNDFFLNQTDREGPSLSNNVEINPNVKKMAYRFVLPYDIMINIDNETHTSLFEFFLNRLLKRTIDPKGLGFLVNHENTYIGNKIIVRNYYEADMMFQNNFFTERFAYLIARNIQNQISSKGLKDKKLLLIGYNQYSEVLLKAIKKLMKDNKVYITILNEEKETFKNESVFDFDVDNEGENTVKEILSCPNDFLFVTIVPIGATLSTNDKIIAFFKQWFWDKSQKRDKSNHESKLDDDRFFYNHCVIVVRNDIDKVTKLEQEQKWESIDFNDRTIKTGYKNAKVIHYTVQIAYAYASGSKDKVVYNWVKRLNDDISFPKHWWDEKYVNYTENSSINSQNLMGFPRVEKSELINDQHDIELDRIYDLRNDIYKGHIEVLNCHHKYYIDTERFVKRDQTSLDSWLKDGVRQSGGFSQECLNVIITPNVERESDFIFKVNEYVFDGNALIIYLDVNNWRNNMVHKLSFLKKLKIDSVMYHYVDQAFLTGETYHLSKSYLFSIIGNKEEDVKFDSIITVVNRLSSAKNQEIKREVNHLFSFVNLHYPANKEGKRDCELCQLGDYYKKLRTRTVLNSCIEVINKNYQKIKVIHKSDIDKTKWPKRNFIRLVLTHELYFRIAEIAQQNEESYAFLEAYSKMEDELNGIYLQLSGRGDDCKALLPNSEINKKINAWLLPKCLEDSSDSPEMGQLFYSRLEYDKRVSFLKVISSPPLSKYIAIRKYAHEKLLVELHLIISKSYDRESVFVYEDLKIVKSILKSLSFLKSNALVRKDVIIGVWRVLGRVIENLEKDKKRIEESISWLKIGAEELKKSSQQHQQPQIFTDNSKEDLIKFDCLIEELNHDLHSMNEDRIIQDFSQDLQFFIKNAIVDDDAKATFLGELLRRGDEMTSFDKVVISKTRLSLKNKDKDDEVNKMFCIFNKESFLTNKELFLKEYTNFLVWLFYDNTTIIRKTLENFSRELVKDENCKDLFVSQNGKLNDISVFKEKLNSRKKNFENKVKEEYYYSSFSPYLLNGDDYHLVEKLLYVAYAKLKLSDIKNNKSDIETDTIALMEIFANIMGADSAFWTMKKEKEFVDDFNLYPISLYKASDEKRSNGWIYYQSDLKNEYYTGRLYAYEDTMKFPLIPVYQISNKYGERKYIGSRRLGFFFITASDNYNDDQDIINPLGSEDTKTRSLVASITFLYNQDTGDDKSFRVSFQESGRLLLLLRQEIYEYVIGYLIKEKALDLWERRFWSNRKFDKIYANSAHIFRSVYDEMDEFESLDKAVIKKLSKTWFVLSNETISFFYSNIERNISDKEPGRHCIRLLSESAIINDDNTLGDIFAPTFIDLLTALLKSRWKGKNNSNKIYINGVPLSKFRISEEDSRVPMQMNKHLIRTLIAQCLKNSLAPESEHGHRGEYETKNVYITINKDSIVIQDKRTNKFIADWKKEQLSNEFVKKKEYIKQMRCEKYSSTTLTSLQGIINYLCEKNKSYSCDFGYDNDNNFFVIINYN